MPLVKKNIPMYTKLVSKVVFITILSSLCILSCKTPENVIYFEDSSNLEALSATSKFEPVFKPNDLVSIVVSSPDVISAQPFNQGPVVVTQYGSTNNTDGTEQPTSQNKAATYLVDSEGNIEFPILGTLSIGGLTRIEAKEMLSEKLKVYVKNPIVSIRINNFTITVLGEVNRPGPFVIPNERVTIVEAMALAGDMTITGKRTNILVRRENGNIINNYVLDMTSKKIADSPAYFLEQNDVVYVEPNDAKIKTSEGNKNTLGIVLSIIGVLLTTVNIIIRSN